MCWFSVFILFSGFIEESEAGDRDRSRSRNRSRSWSRNRSRSRSRGEVEVESRGDGRVLDEERRSHDDRTPAAPTRGEELPTSPDLIQKPTKAVPPWTRRLALPPRLPDPHSDRRRQPVLPGTPAYARATTCVLVPRRSGASVGQGSMRVAATRAAANHPALTGSRPSST
ncbi:hypothetical protein C8Q77DRAFT_570805 [Trametes polyzona]|nr:hypothetical protein C8Q77DRAFT_570805 [Trametes polyzona]